MSRFATELAWRRALHASSRRAPSAEDRRLPRRLAGVRPPDRHRAPELVGALQELGAQVRREMRMRAQELVDARGRPRGGLPAEEGVEPGAEEEDAAVLLDPAQRVEGGL